MKGKEVADDAASIRTTSTISSLSSTFRRNRWRLPSRQSETALPTYEESQDSQSGQNINPARQQADKKSFKKENEEELPFVPEKEHFDNVPDVLSIGGREVEPLVSLDQVQAHLTLLTAFRDLRNQCFSQTKDKAQQEKIWSIYLRRASFRLALYIEQVLPSALRVSDHALKAAPNALLNVTQATANTHTKRDILDIPDDALPPLDVMMLWHAYLLNPGRYAEDSARVDERRILHHARFPIENIAKRIQSNIQGPFVIDSELSAARWVNMTGHSFILPFIAPELTSTRTKNGKPLPDQGILVECPMCKHSSSNPVSSTSSIILSWNEVSEQDWKKKCTSCDKMVNSNVLRGGAFIEDVEQWLQFRPDQKIKPFYMRGGLLSARNGQLLQDDPHAPIFCRLYSFERQIQKNDINLWALLSHIDEAQYGDERLKNRLSQVEKNNLHPLNHFVEALGDIDKLAKLINRDCLSRIVLPKEDLMIDLNRRISSLMKYYVEGDPLVPKSSIDLSDAVLRQFGFIEEMDQMGWLDTASFDVEDDVQPSLTIEERKPLLARSIVRYHRWLNVLAKVNDLLCPTLDIDLAWHTHQLLPSYYADCFDCVGLFVDHDDKVTAPLLGSAFDKTARVWYGLYGQPYSTCGCPVHSGPENLSDSLRDKVKVSMKTVKQLSSSNQNDNTLTKEKRKEGDESHPSVHNVVGVDVPFAKEVKLILELRKKQEQTDIKTGKRPSDHKDAFIVGYGLTPLEPFRSILTTECNIPGKCVTGSSNLTKSSYRVGPGSCLGVRSAVAISSKGQYIVHNRGSATRAGLTTGYYGVLGTSSMLQMATVDPMPRTGYMGGYSIF